MIRISLRTLSLTTAAAIALGAGTAHAVPVNNAGYFGPLMLLLETMAPTATPQQQAAIERALAGYDASTAATTSKELKLIDKTIRTLDPHLSGDAGYQAAADDLVMLHQVGEVGPLLLAANAELVDDIIKNPLGPAAKLPAKMNKKLGKLDLDGDGTPGELEDYQLNRSKFRGRQYAAAKTFEGVIRRFGK